MAGLGLLVGIISLFAIRTTNIHYMTIKNQIKDLKRWIDESQAKFDNLCKNKDNGTGNNKECHEYYQDIVETKISDWKHNYSTVCENTATNDEIISVESIIVNMSNFITLLGVNQVR